MFAIVCSVLHLQAVISQVDVLVLQVVCVVLAARCSDVPYVAKEEVVVAEGQAPHADVELSALVKKRSLQILLNHPVGIVVVLPNTLKDLVHLVEYLNPFALIVIRRLHNPHILCTVFCRDFLMVNVAATLPDFSEPLHELMILESVQMRADDERRRRAVEYRVAALD